MFKYSLINLVFVIPAFLFSLSVLRQSLRPLIILAAILLLLTIPFDNLIILVNIVEYNPANILGIKIGVAPIEDFAYALVAALVVPALWEKLRD